MHFSLRKNEGFTILEVLLVLLLISIFAAVAVARQPSTDVTLKAASARLKAHLRYAQMRAADTSNLWGIHYNDELGVYWLFKDTPETGHRSLLPGESRIEVDDLAQKSIIVAEGDFTIGFGGWGNPENATTLLVTLSKGAVSETITITPNTGFIH